MEWSDTGIIIHLKKLGESQSVITLFTKNHGKCSGVFRLSKQNRGWLQLGTRVEATWRARLETQLGQWRLEPQSSQTPLLFDHPGKLAALTSACSLCHLLLPEGHTYPDLFHGFESLMAQLFSDNWGQPYALFERDLLAELGYGLDLSQCAITGRSDNLVAVSPKTGRAACLEVAKQYEGKLLPLPLFFLKNSENSLKELLEGLHLTGYFLERFAFSHLKVGMPPTRGRLLKYLEGLKEKAA